MKRKEPEQPLSEEEKQPKNKATTAAIFASRLLSNGLTPLFTLLDAGAQMYASDDSARIAFCLQQLDFYNKKFGDWKKYVMFSDLHYTRNLVQDNDLVEIIVLCWSPGQISRVHDHGASDCFMVTLQGEVHEKRFNKYIHGREVIESQVPSKVGGACPELKQVSETILNSSSPAVHIHDNQALHSVGNYSSERAITLHVYTPPIRRVKIFEDLVTQRMPGFFSVHGRPTGKS
eukprot:gb/GEZN01010395.1/.p1 GENE.gb/GEZN01010395.1/~~gb/GEZN01010395.1/.p1  ORF type:complete len:232 (-),score=30.13 gb/GEZN01010395.1/:525-1220(-)